MRFEQLDKYAQYQSIHFRKVRNAGKNHGGAFSTCFPHTPNCCHAEIGRLKCCMLDCHIQGKIFEMFKKKSGQNSRRHHDCLNLCQPLGLGGFFLKFRCRSLSRERLLPRREIRDRPPKSTPSWSLTLKTRLLILCIPTSCRPC